MMVIWYQILLSNLFQGNEINDATVGEQTGVLMFWLSRLGAEWKSQVQYGSQKRIASEFYSL